MAKITKLDKRTFFNNLRNYLDFAGEIRLMHAQHQIAVLTVSQYSAHQPKKFNVEVRYVGNTLNKRRLNSFKSDYETETVTAFNWSTLSYHEEKIFDWRTIEIVEAEVKVEPVKTDYIPGTDVTIEGTPKKVNAPTFYDMQPGQCFWYDDNLYQKTDCDTAILLKDGTVEEELLDDENVVPQKVKIICVD